MAESGSPITVDGGGSVKIHFDHAHYDPTGNEHKHKNDNAEIARVLVDGVDTPCRPNGKIEIHLRKTNS